MTDREGARPSAGERTAKLTDATLAELRAANLPRCELAALFKIEPDANGDTLPEADVTAMRDYFRRFLPPTGGCVLCGAQQGAGPDDVIAALLGSPKFRWGLAHGEGACSVCGYPARALHYNIGPIKRLPLILQYHPDELRARSERAAEAAEAPTP